MPPRAGRRLDIDALRVGACLAQFVFHTGKVFDTDPLYHVKNSVLSPAVTAVTSFLHLWRMPLFFLLAGWSAAAVLRRRPTRVVLGERARRLLPPLAFGLVVLCPPIRYVERLGGINLRAPGRVYREAFSLGFLEFLPLFFRREFSWSHMWFLLYLLPISLALLPLLRFATRRPDRLGPGPAEARWPVYAPLAPLILIEVMLRPVWGDFPNLFADWANMAVYVTHFVIGGVLACEASLEAALAEEWWRVGLLGLAGLGAMRAGRDAGAVRHVATAVGRWGFVAFLVGAARRWWRWDGRLLRYLSEAPLPLYVLHHTPTVLLAFVIVGWPLGLGAKGTLLLLGSVLVTFGLYHACVRPWPIMRALLGMRPIGRP